MIRIGPHPGLTIRNGRSCRRLAGHRKPPVFTGFVFISEQGQSAIPRYSSVPFLIRTNCTGTANESGISADPLPTDSQAAHGLCPRWQIFRLPGGLGVSGDHTVALRASDLLYLRRFLRSLRPHDNRFGNAGLLNETAKALIGDQVYPAAPQMFIHCAILLAGLYFLLLPPSISQGAAFRWLGALLVADALSSLILQFLSLGPIPLSLGTVYPLAGVSLAFGPIAWMEFAYSLFRRPIPRALRVIEAIFGLLAVYCIVISVFLASGLMPYLTTGPSISVYWVASSFALITPVALAWMEMRKGTEGAGMVLVASILYGCALVAATVTALSILWLHHPWMDFTFHPAGFSVTYRSLALLLTILAMAMQIHKTNQRVRDERVRLQGEMEAARHVQEMLLPSRLVQVLGFQVDAAYHPATEVGGDFFQFFSAVNDSLLVVVGDVSGKGMKAALLVSVIVGALRNRNSDEPAEVLREINSVLADESEGGFTTCCCALFAPDGALTIANAGHLAPYRNGVEMEPLPGLPLGVVRDTAWEETGITLQPGDRIVWMSDGVLEARDNKRNLLGFERAQKMATRSVSEIARAAEQIGQEDDITAVSVTRQPVGALRK